ncbi:MAG: hypothetical protein EHM45_23315 [Desulfobacteraceae bacterium]|nr:MAG: hypothetical protein EHM45_23315 [Desulfobacteraceae bacterium]
MLVFIWDVYSPLQPRFSHHIFLGALYLGGGAVSWKLFSDLHNEAKNPAWMTFPASMLEKYASRIVLSALIFPVCLMIFFAVDSFLLEGVNRLLSGPNHMLFNPVGKLSMLLTAEFLVYQSMFMLGLVYFKKYAPAKAVIAVVAYLFLTGMVSLFVMNIVFGKYSDGLVFTIDLPRAFFIESHLDAGLKAFIKSDEAAPLSKMVVRVYICIFNFFMPLCWITGYFRIKETEV